MKEHVIAVVGCGRIANGAHFPALEKIEGIRVIPSQANYFMIELTGGESAPELTKKLLLNHNLFVKDLSGKTNGEFLRIAIRNKVDNNKLVAALKSEL